MEVVVLGEEELITLMRIERQLEADDPKFSATCARLMSDRSYRWTRHGYDVSIAFYLLFAVISSAVLRIKARKSFNDSARVDPSVPRRGLDPDGPL
ncbi:MAG TPA: DUF3040 domain-containing protein [Pseudonocardia sp.]|uniref:DUF3040 domain-containing protein n=1 Tax=Pseudonocardia sp. TaxID=60912 RepID=UPI002C9817D5|nr:DUF3040 domain-containing protein [Pseudonocardia sp.]HTF51519.1 DUF3040 domain-containing protein [Pseudonocardia sp.]